MSEQATGDCAPMDALAPAHKSLEPFVGRFKAEVTMWMGPGEPMVSTGVMTNEMDLGGRFLRQTYKGDASGGPFPDFEGRGYWGYNTVTNRFEGFWIDTASTFMQHETGDLDETGKVWTMVSEVQTPQGTTRKKSVIRLVDRDHHEMEMFFEQGGQEMKAMEIKYARM